MTKENHEPDEIAVPDATREASKEVQSILLRQLASALTLLNAVAWSYMTGIKYGEGDKESSLWFATVAALFVLASLANNLAISSKQEK